MDNNNLENNDGKMSSSKGKTFFSQRDILWYLVFIGFAVNYMLRINFNIAIVSMVKMKTEKGYNPDSECLRQLINQSDITSTAKSYTNSSNAYVDNYSIPRTNTNISLTQTNTNNSEDNSYFNWTEHEQAHILGAFFWLHWLTQIPGGLLATKYGTKFVFGVSNLIGVLCCFLIPWFCYLGVPYVVFIRVVQGLICGVAWPSMHNMTAQWIPPNERSKFVTAYLGSSVGAAVTFPMCGYIIHWLGWKWVFYVSGLLGCLWYICWYFLVYDSPHCHPRISEYEKTYITNSLGTSVATKKHAVPWKSLMTSKYLHLNILAQLAGILGLFTLMTHGPQYFKLIHGLSIRTTGLLSGLPHLVRVIWAMIFSNFSDFLLRTNKMSRTNVRKFATFCCTSLQGFCMLALAFAGCNKVLAFFFFTAATGINGAVSSGPLASLVDLSPNYASIMLGICNGVGLICGFITPLIVVFFTSGNQSVEQWQKVFLSASIPMIIPGFLYIMFAKSELQPWNSPGLKNSNKSEEEMKPLKEKEAYAKTETNDP